MSALENYKKARSKGQTPSQKRQQEVHDWMIHTNRVKRVLEMFEATRLQRRPHDN